MELREILLIVHILGALGAAAGVGTTVLSTLAASREADLVTIARTARLQALGGRVAAYSLVVVIVFGTWLVIESSGIEFSQAWISAAYVLWLITMGVGGGVVDRHASRLRGAADAAVARGESSNAEVQTLWEAPLPRYANLALAAAFIVFIYLMVAKPGL